MRLPEFYAEAALAPTAGTYRGVASTSTSGNGISLTVARCSGCVIGEFPPGLGCPPGTTCQGGGCGDGRSCWKCCSGGVKLTCAGFRTISATCLI